MEVALLIAILALSVSCDNRKEGKSVIVESVPVERKKISFEKIIFSIYPGWSRERNSKDVEINHDGTIYYRLRDHITIVENYKATLDSVDMVSVYAVLDSIDFNSLKMEYSVAEDAAYHSLEFAMPNGSVNIQGTLADELAKNVYRLLNIVEKQNLIRSKSHHFSTAKDVLLPLPPGTAGEPALLDSL